MSTTSPLVCSCGMTLKTTGARPGRVGKCPRCGSMFRVPDDFTPAALTPAPASVRTKAEPESDPAPLGYVVSKDEPQGRASYHHSPAPTSPGGSSASSSKTADDRGPLAAPRALETKLRQSLGYPLWGWSSVAMLIFLPPMLTVTSAPLKMLIDLMFTETRERVLGLIWGLICLIFGFLTWSYLLAFLADVLISSARGDSHPPRAPDPVNDDVFRTMRRWFCAAAAGVVVGGAPAIAYWIHCGELDFMDRVIIFTLVSIGATYMQMALVAALLHDDPLAVNPITVLGAIGRVGWGFLGHGLTGGLCLTALEALMVATTRTENLGLLGPLSWVFWTVFLYVGMIVLRRLGLFCHRNREALGWFRDRPRWGR